MTSPISSRRVRRTRAQWSQLVKEQAASGLSQQAFCSRQDSRVVDVHQMETPVQWCFGIECETGGVR